MNKLVKLDILLTIIQKNFAIISKVLYMSKPVTKVC